MNTVGGDSRKYLNAVTSQIPDSGPLRGIMMPENRNDFGTGETAGITLAPLSEFEGTRLSVTLHVESGVALERPGGNLRGSKSPEIAGCSPQI